jgi:hypothetical protein
MSNWCEEILRLELSALQQEEFDLKLIGFDDAELKRLLAEQDLDGTLTDADAVPHHLLRTRYHKMQRKFAKVHRR